MTTSLSVLPPADQLRWHELYKAAPLVIILLYMRTAGERGVTQSEIADNFQISRNTAAQQLRKLSKLGAIHQIDHNKGYRLTHGGRQMLLAFEPGCSNIEHPSLKESLDKDLKDSKDMKERKKQMLNLSPDAILSQTGKLWPGHEVVTFGLPKEMSPEYVLAWVAQAYDQGRAGRLSHPWALVYRRLQSYRSLPDKKYQGEPEMYLPVDFLAALGLAEAERVECIEAEAVRVRTYESTVEARVYDAWTAVLDQLRIDLHKAQFETWVVDSLPVCFEGGLVSIAVRNVYAADWLKTRQTEKIRRALARSLGGEVRVEFVVTTDAT